MIFRSPELGFHLAACRAECLVHMSFFATTQQPALKLLFGIGPQAAVDNDFLESGFEFSLRQVGKLPLQGREQARVLMAECD
jgi:hypothetical protein